MGRIIDRDKQIIGYNTFIDMCVCWLALGALLDTCPNRRDLQIAAKIGFAPNIWENQNEGVIPKFIIE